MLDVVRKTVPLLGLIFGSQALAGDMQELSPALDIASATVAAHSHRDSLASSGPFTIDRADIDSDWSEAGLQLEFQDSSTLGRIRNIRGFSLLTLAETRGSKLFLGMNKRGLFGLHFSSSQPTSNHRVLEIARMPYLNRIETVAELTQ